MDLCDKDLLALLASDLNTYFDLLLLTYQQKLFVFVLNMVHNRQDAEEIVQDAFVNAYRGLKKFSPLEIQMLHLRPWLFKIAYNLSLNHINRHAISPTISIDLAESRLYFEGTEQGQYASPEKEMEEKEALAELYSYIKQLPDLLRVPLILHYIVGLQYSEIAEVLQQPFNTVKSNGRRALKKLHELRKQPYIYVK
jgi:RNA polymerase sigma-70 factor, ECF subfamily